VCFTYSSTGLPPGLDRWTEYGYITALPSQIGTFNVEVTATDTAVPANTAQDTLQITDQRARIHGIQHRDGIVEQPFSFPVTV